VDKLDYLTTEIEKRVTEIARRIVILWYVGMRQRAKQRTTKAEVIRYMKKAKLSSGETTHNSIKNMIKEGKLNVEMLNSQVHFLTVKGEYDLAQFERESLIEAITETHSYFKKNVIENEALVSSLIKTINKWKWKPKPEDRMEN
jgi:hypothetical protein